MAVCTFFAPLTGLITRWRARQEPCDAQVCRHWNKAYNCTKGKAHQWFRAQNHIMDAKPEVYGSIDYHRLVNGIDAVADVPIPTVFPFLYDALKTRSFVILSTRPSNEWRAEDTIMGNLYGKEWAQSRYAWGCDLAPEITADTNCTYPRSTTHPSRPAPTRMLHTMHMFAAPYLAIVYWRLTCSAISPATRRTCLSRFAQRSTNLCAQNVSCRSRGLDAEELQRQVALGGPLVGDAALLSQIRASGTAPAIRLGRLHPVRRGDGLGIELARGTQSPTSIVACPQGASARSTASTSPVQAARQEVERRDPLGEWRGVAPRARAAAAAVRGAGGGAVQRARAVVAADERSGAAAPSTHLARGAGGRRARRRGGAGGGGGGGAAMAAVVGLHVLAAAVGFVGLLVRAPRRAARRSARRRSAARCRGGEAARAARDRARALFDAAALQSFARVGMAEATPTAPRSASGWSLR